MLLGYDVRIRAVRVFVFVYVFLFSRVCVHTERRCFQPFVAPDNPFRIILCEAYFRTDSARTKLLPSLRKKWLKIGAEIARVFRGGWKIARMPRGRSGDGWPNVIGTVLCVGLLNLFRQIIFFRVLVLDNFRKC